MQGVLLLQAYSISSIKESLEIPNYQLYQYFAFPNHSSSFRLTLASGSDIRQDIVDRHYDGCTNRRNWDRSGGLIRTSGPFSSLDCYFVSDAPAKVASYHIPGNGRKMMQLLCLKRTRIPPKVISGRTLFGMRWPQLLRSLQVPRSAVGLCV